VFSSVASHGVLHAPQSLLLLSDSQPSVGSLSQSSYPS
jgi:hypothetical protein